MNKKPMTTKEARVNHLCINCLKGRTCWYDSNGSKCVESETCSTNCLSCRQRVWFQGNWDKDTPEDFNCPYCGEPCVSPYKGGKVQFQNLMKEEIHV